MYVSNSCYLISIEKDWNKVKKKTKRKENNPQSCELFRSCGRVVGRRGRPSTLYS